MDIRHKNWQLLENREFDVLIIGAGINGASIYNRLCASGYKVLLIDKGDFSCGTSQASAMMIWGGLLYLKNLDFLSVFNFSKDRENLIKTHSQEIAPRTFRYISNSVWGRNRYLVYLALNLYWALGIFRRRKPAYQKTYQERKIICQERSKGSYVYQEGFLKDSDSRFVLQWILSHQTYDSFALNYCLLNEAVYSKKDKNWTVSLSDTVHLKDYSVKASVILNCTGVWADSLNEKFSIKTPYRHVFSKGVFIGLKRPESHHSPLIFEMGEHGDTLTFIPWGPISLWGPTETLVDSLAEGLSITPQDIHFLQEHALRNLEPSLAASRIISLRHGIRPLAVAKSFKADCYPLDISRYHKIASDCQRPWITIYGGKISGCITLADKVAQKVAKQIKPSLRYTPGIALPDKNSKRVSFPGLSETFPSITWCIQNEFCCTLEDYLRRRTNISQWVAREGLGYQDENLEHLKTLAEKLPKAKGSTPESHIKEYVAGVTRRFDKLMTEI